jgi:Mg2+ and Co2+ transporter CorA
VDLKLITEFADYVAEITILLGPLQAQINILQRWQSDENFQFPTKISHHAEFAEEIKRRQDHLEYMKELKSQAQESQQIVSAISLFQPKRSLTVAQLFQLTNTMTAHYQSKLAEKMKDETQTQVVIAKRSERQNSAILILSGISVIFLPLSFITSYFGKHS